MKFFDNVSEYFNDLVSGYITGEILLLGLIAVILVCFLSLLIIHLFSKDMAAKRKLKGINKILKEKKYDAVLERQICKRLRFTPHRFFENYQSGLNSMAFQNCVPYYESTRSFGKRFFAVFSGIACLLASVMALILNENNIIAYLSNALSIPAAGLIFAFILEAVYVYLKNCSYKKLNAVFDKFLRLIKPKNAACKSVININQKSEAKTLPQNTGCEDVKVETDKNKIVENEDLFDALMQRIQEIKLKSSSLDAMKDLAGDIASGRDNFPAGSSRKESLTDALTDLLNMISEVQTA